jgi:hypothetical protein
MVGLPRRAKLPEQRRQVAEEYGVGVAPNPNARATSESAGGDSWWRNSTWAILADGESHCFVCAPTL